MAGAIDLCTMMAWIGKSQDTHIEGLPIGTVGGILAKTTLPLDGEYTFSIRLFRTNLGVVRGLEYDHQLEFTVDGERVHLSKIGGDDDFKANLKNMTKAGDDVEKRAAFRMPLKAGPHTITVGVPRADGRVEPASAAAVHPQLERHARYHRASASRHVHADRAVQSRRARATRRAAAAFSSAARRAPPTKMRARGGSSRRFARRAYRGHGDGADHRAAARVLPGGPEAAAPSRRASRWRSQRMLASPKFIFRVERDPAGAPPGAVYRVSDLELASRLSFFLWSSIPDDQLLQVARPGHAAHAGGAEPAGAAHAGRSEVARRWSTTSPASGCTCGT